MSSRRFIARVERAREDRAWALSSFAKSPGGMGEKPAWPPHQPRTIEVKLPTGHLPYRVEIVANILRL
jgi:hypothetical protein